MLSKRTYVYAEIQGLMPDEGNDETALYAAIRHDF